jgi:4-hydroxy-3-methylbut-2-en-1-yl diphosphate reductase
VRFLSDEGESLDALGPDDVVILPAFGVTVQLLQQLDTLGCTLVDTTCGSVLNVWKNVKRYADRGFTSVIHGKVWHEETQATASQAVANGGAYLVVFDAEQAAEVCAFIRHGGDGARFMERFDGAMSVGFDPGRDLQQIGVANQTTMLMSESLAIADMLKASMLDRWGAEALDAHFVAFDTICSATQDRQDAVVALLRDKPIDLMLVIGGYNSSNTVNLVRICAESRPTFHIADPDCLESREAIRHRPVGSKIEVTTRGWLPAGSGALSVGLTSGASTPDNLMGATMERLRSFCQ